MCVYESAPVSNCACACVRVCTCACVRERTTDRCILDIGLVCERGRSFSRECIYVRVRL